MDELPGMLVPGRRLTVGIREHLGVGAQSFLSRLQGALSGKVPASLKCCLHSRRLQPYLLPTGCGQPCFGSSGQSQAICSWLEIKEHLKVRQFQG